MVERDATGRRPRRPPRPLDETRLRDLALAYVARFATSRGKLRAYLARKLRERGWEGDVPPDIEALVMRFDEQGFVDDRVYGQAKADGLLARGYGARRVEQALWAAGLEEELRGELAPEERETRTAALAYARRRRFGPFGDHDDADPAAGMRRREKQLAAMVRAGHDFITARRLVEATDKEELERWSAGEETD